MKINADYSEINGIIKPMHAVNNGPIGSGVRKALDSVEAYKEARIPYARNHDASFCEDYGGEYTVDVHRIFRDFDADVNDSNSYDFEETDKYSLSTEAVGTKTFYRLGSRIEHGKKAGTYPPGDNKKWAQICEHIILHYTRGWANGYNFDIEYWEIWNEPDCKNPDGSTPCWQGTKEEFVDFFAEAYKYLKDRFPELMIGGPTFCNCRNDEYIRLFFEKMTAEKLKLDFFSFHCYTKDPHDFKVCSDRVKYWLKQYEAVGNPKIILNEWNYIKGWLGDDFRYSVKSIKGLKGASFTAACMCVGQMSDIDMLMYYDARPCEFNGLFDSDYMTVLKGYYPFKYFSELYEMKNSVSVDTDDRDLFAAAARDGKKAGILLTYYNDDELSKANEVELNLNNLSDGKKRIDFYLLDEHNNMKLVRSEKTDARSVTLYLNMSLYSVYYIAVNDI